MSSEGVAAADGEVATANAVMAAASVDAVAVVAASVVVSADAAVATSNLLANGWDARILRAGSKKKSATILSNYSGTSLCLTKNPFSLKEIFSPTGLKI